MESRSDDQEAGRGRLVAALRGSYAWTGLSRPEHWSSVAVTLSVALAVLLAGTRPLPAGFSVDLGEPDPHALALQTTVVGFGLPRENGRTTLARTARLIWNRPLPSSFVLEIEAAGVRGPATLPVEVQVGGFRQELVFGKEPVRRELHVVNPGGARSLELHLPRTGPAALAVRRIAVR